MRPAPFPLRPIWARMLAPIWALPFALAACSLSLPFDELGGGEPVVADSGAVDVIDVSDVSDDITADVSDAANESGGETDAADAPDANTCANKVLDGDETDIDCGGSCADCGSGRKCKVPTDCASANCEGGRCATCNIGMVRVPIGLASYCIDATEVTNAQYDAFVAKASPKSVAFPTACKWKATGSFASSPKLGGSTAPVRNVDWCDAWAYCDAQGKRLCGAIGSGTTKNPAPFDKFDDPNVGQWRHACSYGPSPAWPYGAAADANKCNTADRPLDGGAPSPLAVRSLPACIGAPAELNALYDMSGNVAEWEDSCQSSTGASDPCRVRGGSFRDTAANASCGVAMTRNRSDRQDWVGFRCCRL